MFNLSDIPLTTAMESVLNRGLSFVPTPEKIDISLLKSDLEKHSRKILWKYELFEKDIQDDPNAVKDVFKPNKANFPKRKNDGTPEGVFKFNVFRHLRFMQKKT